MIVLTRKVGFLRDSESQKWPSKPDYDYIRTLTEHQYNKNIANGDRWGIERRSYAYTYCGRTPVKISSIEPLYKRAKSVAYYEPCLTLNDVKEALSLWGFSWEGLDADLQEEILEEVEQK